ncbi:MAG: InlB B-repeat-containing protein [Coriobacteriia bacterium]|nr:InlB B-repeat-containing protein [Coriobacteriia bacterium]
MRYKKVLAAAVSLAMVLALVAAPTVASAAPLPSGGDLAAAVAAAASGDTLTLAAGGTYTLDATLVIDKTLTIVGNGATIGVSATFSGNGGVAINGAAGVTNPIIYAQSGDVTIKNLTVKGQFPAVTGTVYNGIVSSADSLTLDQVTVTAIRSEREDFLGVQSGVAVYVIPGGGDATITGCTITDFQKAAIVSKGGNLTVSGTTITGWGPTTVIGQNGIQYGPGATGMAKIFDNTISALDYSTHAVSVIGVLLYSGPAIVDGNTFNQVDQAAAVNEAGTTALFTNITMKDVLWGFTTLHGGVLYYSNIDFGNMDADGEFYNWDTSEGPTEELGDEQNIPLGITITPDTAAMKKGQSSALPSNTAITASTLVTQWSVSYASSDPGIVAVDNATGKMTAVAPGVANITAVLTLTTIGGSEIQIVSNTCAVTVTDVPAPPEPPTPALSLYTVTLDANGGTVSPQSVTQDAEGAAVKLPTPTRKGYTFDGWFTDEGEKVTSPYTPTADITLTAQWTKIAEKKIVTPPLTLLKTGDGAMLVSAIGVATLLVAGAALMVLRRLRARA